MRLVSRRRLSPTALCAYKTPLGNVITLYRDPDGCYYFTRETGLSCKRFELCEADARDHYTYAAEHGRVMEAWG
jgi:hypothetical protein